MKWLLQKIMRWAFSSPKGLSSGAQLVARDVSSEGLNSSGKVRFCLHTAINGRILEIMTYAPNPHGPDWTSEFYLVGDGEKLSDTLTMLLIARNLD